MRRSGAPSSLSTKQTSSTSNVLADILNKDENHIKELEKFQKQKIENRVEAGSDEEQSENSWNVIFGKQTTKKHKTFEEDGILTVKNKTARLFDNEGKLLNTLFNFVNEIETGSVISVGNKLVEIGTKSSGAKSEFPKKVTPDPPVPSKPKFSGVKRKFDPPTTEQLKSELNSESVPNSTEAHLSSETFVVTYGKKSSKMHKTFENDGFLEVDHTKRLLTLKDGNDKTIGTEMNFKCEISIGSRIEIDDKLVEIIEKQGGNTKVESYLARNIKAMYSPPKKKFKIPVLATTSTSNEPSTSKSSFNCPVPSIKSNKFNSFVVEKPKQPAKEAFVLPAPSYQHQWKFNTEQKPVTPVTVCDSLASILRPHQLEGVSFLYKCVMGFNSFADIHYFGCILGEFNFYL